MPQTNVFEQLLDKKLVRVLKLLLANRNKLFHLQKLAADSNVPISTVFRLMPSLVRKGLVEQVKVGKMKLYRLQDNNQTAQLREVLGR